MIREELARRFPDDAIRGEEGGIEGDSRPDVDRGPDRRHEELRDGHPDLGEPARARGGRRVRDGLANAPALGERYDAAKGGGATWNGEPIHVSRRRDHGRGHGRPAATLEAWAGTARAATRLMRLSAGRSANRGFGDFWGHMLVARGAADVMLEPELRDVGLRGRWP